MHISPDDKRLQYCGRIDFDDPKAPVLVYAASFVQIRFTGTEISVTLANKRAYCCFRLSVRLIPMLLSMLCGQKNLRGVFMIFRMIKSFMQIQSHK